MTEREQQLLERQKVLADFGDLAIRSDDLDEVLAEACRLVADALGTERAKILKIKKASRELLVRAGVGWNSNVVGHLRLSMNEHSSETYAIVVGEPVICRDIAEEERFRFPDFMRKEGVRALANVPIFLPGRHAYGVLQVDDTKPRQFTQDDIQFLRTYAAVLGPVIDRLRQTKRLQEAEERHRQREIRFQRIFETAPVGLSVVSPDGRFLRVNKELERILARPRDVLLSSSVADVTHPPDVEPSISAMRRTLEEGETVSLDKRYRRPDGELVAANSSLTPLSMFDGSTGVLAVTVDLTARHEAEEALRRSEERLSALVTASSQVLYSMGPDWSELREIAGGGFLADTVRPNPNWLEDYIHPDDQAHVLDAVERAISAKSTFEYEHRVRRSDGSLGWTLSRAVPLFGPDGEITEWFGAAGDITERRQAEERLRESEERHRLILESALDYAIFTTDADGRIDNWPPGAEAVFGWSAEEVMGELVDVTFTPEDRENGIPEQERATARDEGHALNIRWHVRKGGERIFIDGSTRPLQANGQGSASGFIKIGQNVTARREAEQRQELLFAELQHRTRNLVAVVRSIADRTADGVSSMEAFLPSFRGRLDALARINSLLSKLDHGERVVFDEMIRTELAARGFPDSDGDERVVLDGPAGVRLRSATVQTFALAIHELATNAVKYGALSDENGRLRVSWRVGQDETGLDRLHVEWIESGVSGMPEEGDPPRGGGYGRMLIERALPYQLDATTTYELARDGVRCTIDLPLR
ncbi:PAS domain S-box protein [Antarcticirhabdus aurantiaca]|uniref:PAS domain S-box protein n=1 Tax=Antarcticirhabdus aurantiaca TaxID=2606717 RepID=A0ACD4NWE9_9HYPH|nr:PAS domain S-box protein [Antarcticirhabdus aurantiaca]WAJ31290.1 PAS domain S-box protein [Jeongeuplla avenae]